ncbi:uncharacterized protein LOC142589761 [Dermacentor variabilis]|uniref:uncharacterized protein LOC142589761 n=1 Tax=Dermacentor variabilis TaxID=34621 RepID=UPI003F5B16B1
MRPQVPAPAAFPRANPPPVALRPLEAEPMPPLGPRPPLPEPPRPPAGRPESGEQGGGAMMGGSWGGGISPGSLEGISRLRLCLYGLAGTVVMLLLFAAYTYAMFDEEDAPRAVPGGNEGPGFGENGDRYFPCPRIVLCVEAAGARRLTGDIKICTCEPRQRSHHMAANSKSYLLD